MAITSADVALLNERMRGKVYDQTIRAARFMMWMRKKGRIRHNCGGINGIDFWVQYRETASGARAITPYTELAAKTTDDFKKLTVPWAVYGDAIATSQIIEKRAKNAKDADINFEWLANQNASFVKTFKKTLATDLYSGDGTADTNRGDVAPRMLGLSTWVQAANTIIGENRAGAGAYFAAVVGTTPDPTGDSNFDDEADLLQNMKTLWNNASVGAQTGSQTNNKLADERVQLDLTLSDQTSYELYVSLLTQRMQLFQDGADANYKTITFNQQPYDWDPFCPSGTQFMLNTEEWEICTVEADDQLVSVYAEDNTGIVKKVQQVSQVLLKCVQPRASARNTITLPS